MYVSMATGAVHYKRRTDKLQKRLVINHYAPKLLTVGVLEFYIICSTCCWLVCPLLKALLYCPSSKRGCNSWKWCTLIMWNKHFLYWHLGKIYDSVTPSFTKEGFTTTKAGSYKLSVRTYFGANVPAYYGYVHIHFLDACMYEHMLVML